MCRIAYFPPGTDVHNPLVVAYLEYLVRKNGGDGMGISTWSLGKKPKPLIVKGLKMTVEDVLKVIEDTDPEHTLDYGWLFHARAASQGGKVDELCHPYQAGEWLFVHNGTWMEWEKAYWPLVLMKRLPVHGYRNDSRTIAAMVSMVGPNVVWNFASGVFVTWKAGEATPVLFLVKGDFAYSSLPKGGLIYGSSFPEEWPVEIHEFHDESLVFLEGEKPDIKFGEETKKVKGTYGVQYTPPKEA